MVQIELLNFTLREFNILLILLHMREYTYITMYVLKIIICY